MGSRLPSPLPRPLARGSPRGRRLRRGGGTRRAPRGPCSPRGVPGRREGTGAMLPGWPRAPRCDAGREGRGGQGSTGTLWGCSAQAREQRAPWEAFHENPTEPSSPSRLSSPCVGEAPSVCVGLGVRCLRHQRQGLGGGSLPGCGFPRAGNAVSVRRPESVRPPGARTV